jgi:hypothetical protein
VGQFDPAFTTMMAETQDLLLRVFRTHCSTFRYRGLAAPAWKPR